MTKTVTAGAHVVPASGPTGRLALLLAVIRREGGEWTTKRVQDFYRRTPLPARNALDGRLRHIARGDLLAVIRREGGEWTTGRVKRLYRKRLPAHVLRVTMRRDLAALHADGHMVLHDSPHRRFYTYCTKGENA
jgi:hypothetical protein